MVYRDRDEINAMAHTSHGQIARGCSFIFTCLALVMCTPRVCRTRHEQCVLRDLVCRPMHVSHRMCFVLPTSFAQTRSNTCRSHLQTTATKRESDAPLRQEGRLQQKRQTPNQYNLCVGVGQRTSNHRYGTPLSSSYKCRPWRQHA